jgi:hypothetical protein
MEYAVFKPGKFYAIQARERDGNVVFCEAVNQYLNHSDRLKSIARQAARGGMNDFQDNIDDVHVMTRPNPFSSKLWPTGSDINEIIDHMRSIRNSSSKSDIDPNSLKIVVINCSVDSYVPESPSDEETELRRFVLEKLNKEEKRLLKVDHWDVYNKLADRSSIDTHEDD